MKIKSIYFGIAGATTLSIMYALLALVLKFYPSQTLKFIGTIHMMPKLDYIRSFITVTPQAIALGVITHTIAAFVFFCIMATVYNLIAREK